MKSILIALLLFTQFAFAGELEIKGLRMGMSAEEYLEAFPPGPNGSGGHCSKERVGIHRCTFEISPNVDFTVATVSMDPTLLFHDNKLVSIQAMFFRPEMNFQKVLDAFTAKFSAPTVLKTPILQNAYGATVQDVNAVWVKPEGTIILLKYGGGIDKSAISIQSKWYLDYQEHKDAESSAAAKKDL